MELEVPSIQQRRPSISLSKKSRDRKGERGREREKPPRSSAALTDYSPPLSLPTKSISRLLTLCTAPSSTEAASAQILPLTDTSNVDRITVPTTDTEARHVPPLKLWKLVQTLTSANSLILIFPTKHIDRVLVGQDRQIMIDMSASGLTAVTKTGELLKENSCFFT